ncbi:MAG: dephospho-CoA kinase [Desulfobacteraceae bacterium]|nr:dephospho-CoA kinase [Desulfobacteraceae bacterium]MCF8093806.1 dephospho-CoA kinase [Desulfobacteraceae bacterium]
MDIKEISVHAQPRALAIGVTGNAGSGKSVVCMRFREFGIPVFSADQLARQAVERGTRAYEQIVKHFGNGILAPDKSIDRRKLRRIIIKDEGARKTLENFVHPDVIERIKAHLKDAEKQGLPLAAVEVPLLFETGMQKFFDHVIMVSATCENRIQRIMARDGATRKEAKALMKTQMPEEQKRGLADFVINNNESIREVYRQVDRIYKKVGGKL